MKTRKKEEYKKRVLKDEIKEYNYQDLEIGYPVNKNLIYFSKIGRVIKATIHNGKPYIQKEPRTNKLKITYDNTKTTVYALEVRKLGLLNLILSKFKYGIKFYFVPKDALTENEKEYIIDKNQDYAIDNGCYVFGDTAKEVSAEHISYLKNRENELEALINFLPRMDFYNERLTSKIAELREKAEIEKEKYKGQVEE